jgi:hypothetical protein
MAEMEDVLAELRHRIMGQLKPTRPQHQETNGEGPAMTQPVNIEQRRGSAAVALRRLAHPERDGSAVVDGSVSEPINPERGGVVVGGDPISPLVRRLSLEMPELMEEVVAFIERRTAELKEREDGAAPKPTESVVPAALVRATPPLQDDTGIATISLRFDTQVLARIDAAAQRQGISRTAWLHVAAGERLEGRR